uniref:Uncharacterized protein n=1 Tax=Panagrolaimus sp. JU765 TaxID=591449 RepID=A0AC34RKQ3_9BILA
MHEHFNIKRESRRLENLKLLESANRPNVVDLTNDDGKKICPIPLVDCVCPGEEIDPNDGVKMYCTSGNCIIDPSIVHAKCFASLEDEMMVHLEHSGRKTSTWTKSKKQRNLWSKKGLRLLKRFLNCRCHHGHFLRDDEAWFLLTKEIVHYESEPEDDSTDKTRVRFNSDSIISKWEGGTLYGSETTSSKATRSSSEDTMDDGYHSYVPPTPAPECVIC